MSVFFFTVIKKKFFSVVTIQGDDAKLNGILEYMVWCKLVTYGMNGVYNSWNHAKQKNKRETVWLWTDHLNEQRIRIAGTENATRNLQYFMTLGM